MPITNLRGSYPPCPASNIIVTAMALLPALCYSANRYFPLLYALLQKSFH